MHDHVQSPQQPATPAGERAGAAAGEHQGAHGHGSHDHGVHDHGGHNHVGHDHAGHRHAAPPPARPASSVLLLSAPARLGIAAGLVVALWALVGWAIV